MPRQMAAALILSGALTLMDAGRAPGADAGRIQIVSPEAGTYVAGGTKLRASVDPSLQVTSVTFTVDGREVCSINAGPYECEWEAGSSIEEHQIRLVVILANGDRIARTLRTKGLRFGDAVDVDAVQLAVMVTDNSGRFITGLPKSAFRVFEDGRPQTISNFMSDNVPLEMVVAVDISGSMTPALPKLKQAVKDFLAAIPEHNEVTLLGFNDSIFALTRKSTNPQERIRAVDRLSSWGATALYDTIIRGVDLLGKKVGRRAIVVFSDGEDQGSHVTIDDVERRLQESDVTMYMIGQGRGVSVEHLKQVMQRLSRPTGGRAFSTDRVEELHVAFEELIDELSHQYLVGYEPTNSHRDDSWREIKVVVDGKTKVRTRLGYRAVPSK